MDKNMEHEQAETRCGFVCVIGMPNAGKSTLVNALVGTKVSIVSSKPQTTRCRVLGIAMQDNTQIALIDTPGIFTPGRGKDFERAMVGAAWNALDDADAVLHLVDAGARNARETAKEIVERLPRNEKTPCFLVLNKTDTIHKPDLLTLAQDMNEQFPYTATFMISALKEKGTEDLLKGIAKYMQAGPWLFDPEQVTDMPMRLMAAEITREKIFRQLHRELPYAAFVNTESWDQAENGSITIHQTIYVHRDSQKAIVLGKQGSRIKEIGKASRLELEEILGTRVHLALFVKTDDAWSGRPEFLSLMGLQG